MLGVEQKGLGNFNINVKQSGSHKQEQRLTLQGNTHTSRYPFEENDMAYIVSLFRLFALSQQTLVFDGFCKVLLHANNNWKLAQHWVINHICQIVYFLNKQNKKTSNLFQTLSESLSPFLWLLVIRLLPKAAKPWKRDIVKHCAPCSQTGTSWIELQDWLHTGQKSFFVK